MTKVETACKAVIEFYENYGLSPTVEELVAILQSRRDLVMRWLITLSSQGRLLYKRGVIVSCKAVVVNKESGINWITRPIRVAV